ncbi:MAG: hypothetical protein V3W32_06865 [Gemmatimonadota bacterium]
MSRRRDPYAWKPETPRLEWPGKPRPKPVEPPRLALALRSVYRAMERLGGGPVTITAIWKEIRRATKRRWPTQTIYLNLRRAEDRAPPLVRYVDDVPSGGRGRPATRWELVPREEYEKLAREAMDG